LPGVVPSEMGGSAEASVMPHDSDHPQCLQNPHQPARLGCGPYRAALRESVPLWARAQRPAASRRCDRYLPTSTVHTVAMPPALPVAAAAVYAVPGEVVSIRCAGSISPLVEVIDYGRRAAGSECEPPFQTTGLRGRRCGSWRGGL
jgi:hypothetical protein